MRFPNGAGYFPETEDVWPTDDTYDNKKSTRKTFTKEGSKKNKRQKKGAYESGGEDC